GGQRVLARTEEVAVLAQIDELHGLRLANDELGAALDFLVLVGKTERQCVTRIIRPLDDVDELAADEIGQTHRGLLSRQSASSDPLLGTHGKWMSGRPATHTRTATYRGPIDVRRRLRRESSPATPCSARKMLPDVMRVPAGLDIALSCSPSMTHQSRGDQTHDSSKIARSSQVR